MFEQLLESLNDGSKVPLDEVALRLGLSFVLGGIVALIYALSQRKPLSEMAPMITTLMLLTILIAMVTLIIGGNLARAFSLAGALAIIRFRTIVEDTRDTAFVIFAVVVGMGMGAGLRAIPLLGIPLVALAAMLLSFLGRSPTTSAVNDFSLTIRMSLGRDPVEILRTLFDKHLSLVRLKATTTARQGSALDLTYLVRLRRDNDAVSFVGELNQIEGVQNVELRQV